MLGKLQESSRGCRKIGLGPKNVRTVPHLVPVYRRQLVLVARSRPGLAIKSKGGKPCSGDPTWPMIGRCDKQNKNYIFDYDANYPVESNISGADA